MYFSFSDPTPVDADHLPALFLKEINSIISKFYGMSFDEFSLTPLREKVQLRMKTLKITTPKEYLDVILDGRKELTNLVDSLTVNVTTFFRIPKHFQLFREVLLPEIEKKNKKTRRIRIWSAGCANGAETYSIAMELLNYFGKKASLWDIKILASDINFQCLLTGKKGEYKNLLAREIPEKYWDLYCEKVSETSFAIKDELRKLITWDYHNLLYDNGYEGFDIIFCRNVLYYFPNILRQKTLSLFHEKLSLGGFLLLGSSEYGSIDSKENFQSRRFDNLNFFQKTSKEP